MVTHRMIESDSDSAVMVRLIHVMWVKSLGEKIFWQFGKNIWKFGAGNYEGK